jgi:hypothetical protein
MDSLSQMAGGREFQSLGATVEKALSLKLWSFDLGMARWPAVVEQNARVGWWGEE